MNDQIEDPRYSKRMKELYDLGITYKWNSKHYEYSSPNNIIFIHPTDLICDSDSQWDKMMSELPEVIERIIEKDKQNV